MEVVEHHAERLRAPDREQQLVDRSEQQEPLGLRIGGLRRGRVRRPAARLRASRAISPPCARNVSGEHVVRCMLDQLRADLDPRLVRRRDILAARAPADREPLGVRAQRRMRRQPRLPDPRLAGQEHRLAGARPRLRARALHQRPLVRAADIRRPRHRSQRRRDGPRSDLDPGLVRQRLPHHRERLHRLGNPLQLQLSHRLEPGALDPARQHLRRRRHQDPVSRRLVAQPRRLDRRHPEVVPVLDRRLARPEPDPDMQRLLRASVAPLEQLLRQHRTRHRRRRRRERHEQPVAGVLELAPPGRVDRVAQQREVLAPAARPPAPARPPSPTCVDPTRSTSQIVASSTVSAMRAPLEFPGPAILTLQTPQPSALSSNSRSCFRADGRRALRSRRHDRNGRAAEAQRETAGS